MSNGSRLGLILAAVVVLIGGFLLAKGSDDDSEKQASTTPAATTAAPAPTTSGAVTQAQTTAATTATQVAPPPDPVEVVTVEGGQPEGGVKDIEVDKGDRVRLRVDSDTADEIHIHGYDISKDVEAGGSVSFSFKADIDGKYEIELEDAGVEIASLVVNP